MGKKHVKLSKMHPKTKSMGKKTVCFIKKKGQNLTFFVRLSVTL